MEVILSALQGFFPTLLRMSLSAAVLTGVVILLRFFLRKAPKWVRCLLWLLVAVRLLCPAVPQFRGSLMPLEETRLATGEGLVSAMDEALPSLELETPRDYAVNHAAGEARDVRVSTEARPDLYLPVLWASGVLAMLLWALASFLRLRRRTAASVRFAGNAYLCDGIDSPFILGVLRPRIILPSGLEEPRLSHVLAHERAHLRRRDHLWKPFGFLLLALHWFNPVLWLAYFLLCRDIELACDERAVRDLDPESRADYSQALLDLSRPGRAVAACPLAFGEAGVKQRVKNVLNYRKPAFWVILGALVLAALAAVFFLTDPVPLQLNEDAIVYTHYFDDYSGFELDPEAGKELAGLIRQYGKRRIRNTAWSGTLDMQVSLGDGQHMVIVQYRYANSFSFWKGVEDDYHSTVLSGNGNWRMEFDFDAAFLAWKSRWIPSLEERKDSAVGLFYGISDSDVIYLSEAFRQWMEEGGSAGADLPILPEAYDPEAPAATWPKFCITPEKDLLIRQGPDTNTWVKVGRLRRFDPTAENFDRFYWTVQDTLPDLRNRTRHAWRAVSRDAAGTVIYDLLELDTTQLYLAYGYVDEGGAGDPDSDDSTVCWLLRLNGVMEGKLGTVVPPRDLRVKYPEYYDLPTDKGLELYVWQMAEGAWSCGLMAGTNREKTHEELWNLRAASVREMKEILASYKLPAEEIAVIPIYVPYSSYMYVIDEDYRAAVREMFFGKEEPALLSVSCSGEDSILPYLHSRWSETWIGDGFLAADGEPVEYVIAEHRDEIPILVFREELKLRLAEGVRRRSPFLRVYDQELKMLISQPDEDLSVLGDLPPGTYWCSLVVSRKGTYIPEADRCESYGYNCIFALIIPG